MKSGNALGMELKLYTLGEVDAAILAELQPRLAPVRVQWL